MAEAGQPTKGSVLNQQKHRRRPDPVRLWMLGDGASVLFLVWDATMPALVRDIATPDAEHGRGLTIVEALCVRWGAYYPDEHPGGKVVWTLMRAAALSSDAT